VAVVEQAFANVRADEARAAGDEKIHAATLTMPAPAVERGERDDHLAARPLKLRKRIWFRARRF
jgi:hypothetical protein